MGGKGHIGKILAGGDLSFSPIPLDWSCNYCILELVIIYLFIFCLSGWPFLLSSLVSTSSIKFILGKLHLNIDLLMALLSVSDLNLTLTVTQSGGKNVTNLIKQGPQRAGRWTAPSIKLIKNGKTALWRVCILQYVCLGWNICVVLVFIVLPHMDWQILQFKDRAQQSQGCKNYCNKTKTVANDHKKLQTYRAWT